MAEEENDDMEFDDMEDVIEGLEEIEQEEETTKDSRALQYLTMHHPECRLDYMEDVAKLLPLSAYPPDNNTDKNHKSVPYLTLFEKTKILGFRANQLAQGSVSFVHVPAHVTDVLEIAALELEQKRLPYILKRPMPDGSFEYIRLADLLVV